MDEKLSEWILNCPRLTTREEIAKKVAQFEDDITSLKIEVTQLRKDQAPFIAQINQRKTYEVRCGYCSRTPSEAKGGYICSTCKQG